MTRPVVIDACCLIDLHKVQLHAVTLALPYRFLVPAVVRHSELLNLTELEWRRLETSGLETVELSLEEARQLSQLRIEHAGLSLADCACLVAARHHEHSILLTADKRLRRVAEAEGRRVHGVLWMIDQLYAAGVCGAARLTDALERWIDDPEVFPAAPGNRPAASTVSRCSRAPTTPETDCLADNWRGNGNSRRNNADAPECACR